MIRTSLRTLIALCLFLPWLAFAGPVDVNGVGPRKAAAIVAHREQHGPFRSHQDLARVKGIGENLVQKNKSLIRFGETDPAAKQ